MKRFRSKVATLLDLRRRREEQVLRSHATALFERQAALDRLQAVSGAIESLRQDIGQSMASGCSAAVLAQFHGYGGRLEADRTAAANAVGQAEAAVAKSLEKVLGARRERESVEKFQAKERESHERENLRDEQKLLDEIALRRVSGVWGARALA